MKKNCKHCLSLVLILVILLCVLPIQAMAAVSDYLSFNGASLSGNNATLTVTKLDDYTTTSATSSATISNITDKKITVTFKYAVTASGAGTTTVSHSFSSNVVANADGTASVVLNPTSESGSAFTVSVTASCADYEVGGGTVTMSEITVTEIREAKVTVNYDSNLGSIAGYAPGMEIVVPEAGLTMTATAKSGVTFLGWADQNGKRLSTSATYTVQGSEALTAVKACFAKSSPWFLVDGGNYLIEGMNEAATKAKNASNKVMVLANNATLPSGNYSIPSGVTLLIPYDDANTVKTTTPNVVTTQFSKAPPSAYRILTMADGAKITVAGAISVGGSQSATMTEYSNGAPVGKLGIIEMNSGSSITIQNKASLYAWGYIAGAGTVTIENGGTVYECFQIADWRGGTCVTKMITTRKSYAVFPISQYYVQNVQVPMTLNSGAVEKVVTSFEVTGMDYPETISVDFISNSTGMFRINSGSITKDYDETNDRLVVTVNGTITMANIKLSVALIGSSKYDIDSADYVLGLNSNVTVILASDSYVTLGQDFAMLPGALLDIKNNATLTLADTYDVFVYGLSEWGGYCSSSNINMSAVKFAYPKLQTTRTLTSDAQIIVGGTLVATAGKLYSTGSGVLIVGTDESVGKIVMTKGSSTSTNQAKQKDSFLGQTVDKVSIKIQSAPLKNKDGSNVATTSASNTTYEYYNGEWCTHSSKTAIGTAVEATCQAAGMTAGEKCANCGKVITAQKTVDQLKHAYTGAWVYTAEGHAQKCVNGCGQPNPTKSEHTPAEAVRENVNEATCTAPGSYDEVVYCSVEDCGHKISSEPKTISQLAHTFDKTVAEEKYLATAATCTAKATYYKSCACGEKGTDTFEHGEPLNHSYDYTKAPQEFVWAEDYSTCTAVFKCVRCDMTNSRTCSVATETVKGENCQTKGTVTYTATYNGHTNTKTAEGPVGDHRYSENWTNTDSSTHWHACTVCGDKKDETAHSFENYTYEWSDGNATCTATRTCDCGYYETETLEDIQLQVEDSTCTKTGKKTWTADFAATWAAPQKATEEIPMKAHSLVSVGAQAPTCTGIGWDAYQYCSNCSYTTYVEKPDLGHDFTQQIKDEDHLVPGSGANCKSVKQYYYDCSRCDVKGNDTWNSTEYGPHDMATAWTTENSQHFHKCQVEDCDHKTELDDCSDVTTDKDHKCDVCGAENVTEHSYGEWVQTEAPSCGVAGSKKQTCNCGHEVTAEVPALSHSWNATTYSWEKVNNAWTCTASHTCTTEGGCGATETANATVTSKQTLDPTYNAMGQTTYTATFDKDWAQIQTKVETDVAMLEGEARVGDTNYGTLAEAVANVGENDTITVLKNLKVTETVTIPKGVTLDFNGFTVEGTVLGTLKINKGLLITAQGYKMIGTGADYYSASDDVVLTMVDVAGSITIHSGTVNMLTDNWSLPGQTLTVGENAQFVVPTGVLLNVNGANVVINGKASISGTVNLYSANATITVGEKGSIEGTDKIITNAGDKVLYNNGVYSVHSHDLVQTAANAATCLATGNNEYWTCSDTDCGEVFKDDKTTPTTVEAETIPALGHKDNDKNHACDNGCNVYQGTHADADKDHVCDYGCSEKIGTCEDENTDHKCDYSNGVEGGCQASFGTCEDKDLDHDCDYGCDKFFGTCEDKDLDHDCDYGCDKSFGTCEDADKDHDCDYGCDKNFGEHKDSNKNHACDYGCSVTFGTCVDENHDHKCDYSNGVEGGCQVSFGTHADSNTDQDHVCDYGCGVVMENCSDVTTDDNHNCDVCGAAIGDHVFNKQVTTEGYRNTVATCVARATYFFSCDCGQKGTETFASGSVDSSNHVHTAEHEQQDSTCMQVGYKAGTFCDDCENWISGHEEIPVNENAHEWVIQEFGPKTNTDGSYVFEKERICKHNSNHTETAQEASRVITEDEDNKATCVATGIGSYYVTFNKDWATAETITDLVTPVNSANHANEQACQTEAATCTDVGYTGGKYCYACKVYTVDRTEQPALGHDIVIDEAVAPTCTETGLTAGEHCSRCNDATVAQEEIRALGHTEATREENRKEANCGVAGSYDLVTYCSVCNEVIKTENKVLNATGNHRDENPYDGSCDVCGTAMTPVHGGQAAIGNAIYPTLADAINAAQPGAFINIRANITSQPNVTIAKNVTIITNGYTLWNTDAVTAIESITDAAFKVTTNYGIIFVNQRLDETTAVAKIVRNGSDFEFFATVKEALEAAQAGDTVVLVDDSNESQSDMVIAAGVKLNLGTHTLHARSLVGVKEGKLYGDQYGTSDGYARLFAKALTLDANAYVSNSLTYLPVYVTDASAGSHYVIVRFNPTTNKSGDGLVIDKANNHIVFKFRTTMTGAFRPVLQDSYSAADNKLKFYILLSWTNKTDGATIELSYLFTDQGIQTGIGGIIGATVTGYDQMGIDDGSDGNITSLAVRVAIVTESGATAYGDFWYGK